MCDMVYYVAGNFGAEGMIAFQPGMHFTIVFQKKIDCVFSARACIVVDVHLDCCKLYNEVIDANFVLLRLLIIY